MTARVPKWLLTKSDWEFLGTTKPEMENYRNLRRLKNEGSRRPLCCIPTWQESCRPHNLLTLGEVTFTASPTERQTQFPEPWNLGSPVNRPQPVEWSKDDSVSLRSQASRHSVYPSLSPRSPVTTMRRSPRSLVAGGGGCEG